MESITLLKDRPLVSPVMSQILAIVEIKKKKNVSDLRWKIQSLKYKVKGYKIFYR